MDWTTIIFEGANVILAVAYVCLGYFVATNVRLPNLPTKWVYLFGALSIFFIVSNVVLELYTAYVIHTQAYTSIPNGIWLTFLGLQGPIILLLIWIGKTKLHLEFTSKRVTKELAEANEALAVANSDLLDMTRNFEVSETIRADVVRRWLHAEDEARRKIASTLHDDAIQMMAATALQLDSVVVNIKDTCPAYELDKMARATSLLRETIHHTRTLMFELRPALLEATGLVGAVNDLCEQVRNEMNCFLICSVKLDRYDETTEYLVYRICVEALTNIRKHSEASEARVFLWAENGSIVGYIRDNGRGFEVESLSDRSQFRLHMGIQAVRERVHLARGEWELESAPGTGTLVRFRVPGIAPYADFPE